MYLSPMVDYFGCLVVTVDITDKPSLRLSTRIWGVCPAGGQKSTISMTRAWRPGWVYASAMVVAASKPRTSDQFQ